MKKEELQRRVDAIKWFHSIELPHDEEGSIVTPGLVDHCSEDLATSRFGIPSDLSGKTVVDIGANNGYFSFLAEKRGASVLAIEPNQGNGDNHQGFYFAKLILKSSVDYFEGDLREYFSDALDQYDISLMFGVLYHVEDPIRLLRDLFFITKEYSLIETAISPEFEMNGKRLSNWQFNHGFNGDTTNFWYPNLAGLENALKFVGFKKMELLYLTPGGERCTVKAYR